MEKFIVSARKYRPQTFDTVVGQEHITTTLKNAIKNQQLAHAFLFCGPRGVGKTTCARILAKTINCESVTSDGEACNECNSCKSFNEGTSLNIHELDAASNNSVDDIRALVDQVRFAPQAGKYKVYIIDEVHMLSSSAFNAFLKTLEEPPPYAIFILATTEKHKILPTILSRCQIFDFKRITTNDTVKHLEDICRKEHINAEKAALQLIAQKSEGCMRDSLSIMDKIVSFTNGELNYKNTLEHLNILDADYYFKLLDALKNQDLASALLLFDDINRKGFEGDQVLNGFAEFFRNLLVCKDSRVLNLLEVVESFKDRYGAQAASTETSFIISALNILNEAEMQYKAARNKRLHIELTLIKLSYLQQALSMDSDGKKKLLDTVKPLSFRGLKMQLAPNQVKDSKAGNNAGSNSNDGISNIGLTNKGATNSGGANGGTNQGEVNVTNPSSTGARLTIDESLINDQPASYQPVKNPVNGSSGSRPAEKAPAGTSSPEKPKPKSTKLGSLSSIREQLQQNSAKESFVTLPLSPELLQEYWNVYAEKVKENKNPAYTSLAVARLHIIDESKFTVETNNNLEQKFIEQERRMLAEFLQNAFRNRSLSFSVIVSENPIDFVPAEKTLNKKEQFLKMVEQYPMVKELKDRLRLELDY
jgi:DNA polymerase III subunit gamma/tau